MNTMIVPVSESAADDKVAQTYGRVKELLKSSEVPALFLTMGRVPAFLQDFYMNYKKFVCTEAKLTVKTKTLLALAVSTMGRCSALTQLLNEQARAVGLTEQEIADGIAVASTCAMYNVFFKFIDNSGSGLFAGMGVGLRAHTFSQTSLDQNTTELLNVVISDINGCKPCTIGHVAKALELGLTHEQLLEGIQCGATVQGGVVFLNAAGG